jgi:hypothetical protein
VKGVAVADYLLDSLSFSYDQSTRTATWALTQPLVADAILLHVTNFVTDEGR